MLFYIDFNKNKTKYLEENLSLSHMEDFMKTSFIIAKKNYTLKKFPNKKYANKHLSEGRYKVAVVQCGCPSVSLLGKHIIDNIKI